jgi:predicted phosphodiesterase
MNDDALHSLVVAVKDLALELGRTPTRAEVSDRISGAHYKMGKLGGYAIVLKAAGLESVGKSNKPKITNQIFERQLEPILERFEPRARKVEPWPKIAVISDVHWPFHSQRVLNEFYAFIELHQPEHIILNGDAWDMYSHSKYPRSQLLYNPKEEQQLSRKANEAFWLECKKRCPNSKCYQMLGNHDIRPLKRVLESYPAAEDWIEQMMQTLFTFDGVTTFFDYRQELILPGNIMVHHGYRSKLGDHRDYTRMNSIVGHTHLGGAVFRQIHGSVMWELNSGVAGDPESKALSYTPQKITHWTAGFGWVDQYGPRFIPA